MSRHLFYFVSLPNGFFFIKAIVLTYFPHLEQNPVWKRQDFSRSEIKKSFVLKYQTWSTLVWCGRIPQYENNDNIHNGAWLAIRGKISQRAVFSTFLTCHRMSSNFRILVFLLFVNPSVMLGERKT